MRRVWIVERLDRDKRQTAALVRALASVMIELSEAALIAHRDVFSGTPIKSPIVLDVIAASLSGPLTVSGMRDSDGQSVELTEGDYAKGSFRRGATRFEYGDGRPSISSLTVRKADFAALLGKLAAARDAQPPAS